MLQQAQTHQNSLIASFFKWLRSVSDLIFEIHTLYAALNISQAGHPATNAHCTVIWQALASSNLKVNNLHYPSHFCTWGPWASLHRHLPCITQEHFGILSQYFTQSIDDLRVINVWCWWSIVREKCQAVLQCMHPCFSVITHKVLVSIHKKQAIIGHSPWLCLILKVFNPGSSNLPIYLVLPRVTSLVMYVEVITYDAFARLFCFQHVLQAVTFEGDSWSS